MLVGTPDELIDQIAELREIGVEHLSLEFVGRDFADFQAQIETFATEVRPRL
jgi:alkanesulfonate monooxygenase SsuD/methylene tetrahydromethanopterin reductase-like flavin-dependent oxidoreductase (luciferase family)